MTRDPGTLSPTLERLLDLRMSATTALAGSIALVLAISVGDFVTGPYLVFATFYLVPVVTTAWFVGRRPAIFIALLAAVVGITSTALDPGDVTPPVYLWNGLFRFLSYAFIAVLVDAERSSTRTIRELSEIDPLTGLPNRRHFYAQAQVALERARRTDTPIAMAYFDVDDLKARNDAYGHQAGDEMLAEFADLARGTFREIDLLARLGGDEFCVLIDGADLAAAEHAIDRFVTALEGASVLPIRMSAGIVAGPVDEGLDVEAILHDADALMYEAKSSGKGQRRSRPSLRAER